MQKKYGDGLENFEAKDSGFQWLLGDYCIEDVREAFKVYLTREPDLPAPANIISIIKESQPSGVSVMDTSQGMGEEARKRWERATKGKV